MIVKIIQDLGNRKEKMLEMFTQKTQKNLRTEMNNTLEEINSRITEEEECINALENRIVEITAAEQNIEKRMGKKK